MPRGLQKQCRRIPSEEVCDGGANCAHEVGGLFLRFLRDDVGGGWWDINLPKPTGDPLGRLLQLSSDGCLQVLGVGR